MWNPPILEEEGMAIATERIEAPRQAPRRRAKIVQVAIPGDMLARIEADRARARIPTTRTTWILEALADRLERVGTEEKD